MSDIERIAIVDIADDLQVRKQRIFKLLPRLGITPEERREESRGNQLVKTVSSQEAAVIRQEIERNSGSPTTGASPLAGDDAGYFYIIQLEPEHDPGRYKVGFTSDLDGRLRKHRCSAPFSTYIESWPCKRTWEKTVIDCVTATSERLHTEVFRAQSVQLISELARAFFAMMPSIEESLENNDADQESDEGG